MVVSVQMRLGGFYDWVTRRLAESALEPPLLLGALILVVAGLAAVFSNDIVCLTVAPVLIDSCRARKLDPVPYLLALACASNIGSAATLIGNPQNILIGETLHLSFAGYFLDAAAPVIAGLIVTWDMLVARSRTQGAGVVAVAPTAIEGHATAQLDRWQTAKGLAIASAIVLCFVFTSWPRDLALRMKAGG